jgi:hypothetical protein
MNAWYLVQEEVDIKVSHRKNPQEEELTARLAVDKSHKEEGGCQG